MAGVMHKVSLRNLAAHKVRLALTVLSVVLGTAFVAGSFIFTDTLQKTFDGIFDDLARGVDVRVSPKNEQQQGLMLSRGVPLSDAEAIRAMPDVRAVAPGVFGAVVLFDADGKAVQTGGAPSMGESYLPAERSLEKQEPFIDGVAPTRPGEIGLNDSAARKAGLHVGDQVKILVPSKTSLPMPVQLTGLYKSPTETGGFIGIKFAESQAAELFTDGQHVRYIDVAAQGISANELRDRIQAAYPDYKVQTGDEVREEMKGQIGEALSFINYFLLAFGAIALLVGTFIIYNTFSMIVAQRLRELALLRAVGASRAQVRNSVTLEAFVIGLVGSAIGVALGVALAYGLGVLLNAFDVGLPTGTLQLQTRTVIVAVLLGVVVTVASAYAPAQRAAKVPPVEAMREEFASTGDSLRLRTLCGAALGAAGAGLVIYGAQDSGPTPASIVGIGAAVLVLAVLLAAPWLSRPVVGALGAPFARSSWPVGRLARNNAVRNPRRTAATAFALTLGLMLVTAIGMLGSSAKASIDELVDNGVRADYVLGGPQGSGVPSKMAELARDVDGVAQAIPVRPVFAQVNGEREQGISFGGPYQTVVTNDIVAGTAELPGDGLLVSQSQADEKGWGLGARLEFEGVDKQRVPITVTGVYADTALQGKWIASDQLFQKLMPQLARIDFIVLVKAAPGADIPAMRGALEQAAEPFDVVQVMDREQFKGEQARQIDTVLAIVYGLLGLAVIIAILGIVNTLALSAVERRREIGMLRAIGMARGQVQLGIYLESVLISIFGAVMGVILGGVIGWALVRSRA